MEKTNQIQRIFRFGKRHLYYNGKTLLTGFGGVSGLLVFILSMMVISNSYITAGDILSLAFPFVYAGGFILTSIVFREMHSNEKACHYITLPVSIPGRLIGAWMLTSPGYLILSVLVLYLINGFIFLLSLLVDGASVQFIDLFSSTFLKSLGTYLVVQPIFLLGAIYFRKNNFLKTLLALFLISIVTGAYAVLNAYLVFGPDPGLYFNERAFSLHAESIMSDMMPAFAEILFWYIQAPLFLIISYFRLKETQI